MPSRAPHLDRTRVHMIEPTSPEPYREGMVVARAKGHLRGKQPKLNPSRKPTWRS